VKIELLFWNSMYWKSPDMDILLITMWLIIIKYPISENKNIVDLLKHPY